VPQASSDESDGSPRSDAARWRRAVASRGMLAVLSGMLAVLIGVFAFGAWRDHQATLESGWQSAERGALGAAEHARRTLSAARLLTLAVSQDIRRDGFDRFRSGEWADTATLAR
jgi:hypothetical protein